MSFLDLHIFFSLLLRGGILAICHFCLCGIPAWQRSVKIDMGPTCQPHNYPLPLALRVARWLPALLLSFTTAAVARGCRRGGAAAQPLQPRDSPGVRRAQNWEDGAVVCKGRVGQISEAVHIISGWPGREGRLVGQLKAVVAVEHGEAEVGLTAALGSPSSFHGSLARRARQVLGEDSYHSRRKRREHNLASSPACTSSTGMVLGSPLLRRRESARHRRRRDGLPPGKRAVLSSSSSTPATSRRAAAAGKERNNASTSNRRADWRERGRG